MSELGKTARLSSVGDRVDFVVTLGSGPSEASGRLERQTRGGIVAIREYRDARCEQVAEALALTLDLALDPEASPAARAVPSLPGPNVAAPAAVTGADAAGASAASREASTSTVALGAQASITCAI